ncbi:MAG: hypothetical protein ABJK28_06060 [Algibacter sp.]
MNDLFLMNQQVEKSYAKIQEDIVDASLKSFFKEKAIERNGFCELLQKELNKLETKIDNPLMMNRRNRLASLNFKKLLHFDEDIDLFKQVYSVMQLSVRKYNELLMEMHLPLSLCKLLIKQRDRIQSSLDLMRKEVEFK